MAKRIQRLFSFKRMAALDNLKFDNLVLRTLPLDKETTNETRTVPGACFSLLEPTPVENPKLIAHSPSALNLLGISEDVSHDELADYFSGNKRLTGSRPAAHCYCGHQFGYFSGQLGDGAAMYLGEILNGHEERWEVQLKGAGKTPYSRHSDGRKVLRSSVREFLCSEAMHHLGVPTTRAGTCVTSDSRVVRDIFYDGHPIMERCTIVSRIAPTFLRFGSFEIFKNTDSQTGRRGPSVGRTDILHSMLEYVIKTFFPHIDSKYPYLEFYKEVVKSTAKLAALWQCVGFCHGVLNTDNMSILGLTIDYGPFGFMDYFDPDYICNASDNQGRYSYVKQPEICKWNLMKLAEALDGALPLDMSIEALNDIYDKEFHFHYYKTMRSKLGLTLLNDINDEELIQKLLWTMSETSADFTNTFRFLSDVNVNENDDSEIVAKYVSICQSIEGVKKKTKNTVHISQQKAILQIATVHPELIEQLGMTQEQIKAMIEKSEKMESLKNMTCSEKASKDEELWRKWLHTYRERLKLEVKHLKEDAEIIKFMVERKKQMNSVNPCVILRNHLVQEAIKAAEDGDFSKVRQLLKFLENPYNEPEFRDDIEHEVLQSCAVAEKYQSSAPLWAGDLRVT